MTIQIPTSQKNLTLLLAGYVALESYFLSLILGSLIGRFWFSGAILNLLAVFTAYLIADTIVKQPQASRRKKIILGLAILAITFMLGIVASVLALYLAKLQLQSTHN